VTGDRCSSVFAKLWKILTSGSRIGTSGEVNG
jgi:hypothetical protein